MKRRGEGRDGGWGGGIQGGCVGVEERLLLYISSTVCICVCVQLPL